MMMMKTRYTKLLLVVILLTTVFSMATQATEVANYSIDNFVLKQKNWDEFTISFKVGSTLYAEELPTATYKIELLAEDGSILKTFRNTSNLSVNDKNLGSKEKLTFKLTVDIDNTIISKETSVMASEKSVIVKNKVNIPLEEHISVGNAYVSCELLRRNFTHSDKWEKVGDFKDVGVTLFVGGGLNKDHIEVPLNKKFSNFDLANYKYYDDLKMQIEKDLFTKNTAEVEYYYQFNWDRNVYVVYGGSKNINQDKNEIVVYTLSSDMMQRLVNTSTINYDLGVASASAY